MSKDWIRDELLLTFNLYCKIPFAKTKANNPAVIELARRIDRSPAAVAMKLGNFGSFDPALRAKGISGLTRASKADRIIWNEFHADWENLAVESELAAERISGSTVAGLRQIQKAKRQPGVIFRSKKQTVQGPSEVTREVKVRLHQRFFRQTVLASYGIACCVCRNPIPELLAAGHIIPWSEREDLRVNPRNGLCLCSLHHDAFDCGFWCVDSAFQITLSPELHDYLPNKTIGVDFMQYSTAKLHLPEKFWPEQEFLAYHRKVLFRG